MLRTLQPGQRVRITFLMDVLETVPATSIQHFYPVGTVLNGTITNMTLPFFDVALDTGQVVSFYEGDPSIHITIVG